MFSSRKDTLGFDDRIFLLIGTPVMALLVNTLLFGHLLKDGQYMIFGSCYPISIYFTLLYWLTFREFFYFLIKKYPDFADIRKRQSILILGVFVGYFAIDFLGGLVLDYIFKYSIEDSLIPNPIIKIITSVLFNFLGMVVYESFFLAKLLANSIAEKEKLITQNIQSKLSSLQSQVNPHFLFNSLNTLSSLIHEDANRAEKFVTKLSHVYRHVLEHNENDLVTVRSELHYLRSYVHLLKERFEENLHFFENIDESTLDKYVIPLALQITFENCVKHNIVTKEQPLKVSISNDPHQNYICIENNINLIKDKDESTSVGLDNIKHRYAYFTNQEVKVTQDTATFKVCLPLLSDFNSKIN
jgi:sensor histidine kinase YesM